MGHEEIGFDFTQPDPSTSHTDLSTALSLTNSTSLSLTLRMVILSEVEICQPKK